MKILLLCMSLCGSIALLIYCVAGKILGVKLAPAYRYLLLKLVMVFYLVPFPLLANDMKEIIRVTLRDRNLFIMPATEGVIYREDISKIFYIAEGNIYFPEYENWFLLLMFFWFLLFLIFLGLHIRNYLLLRKTITFYSDPANITVDSDFKNLVDKRNVTFRTTRQDTTAFTYGILHPVVVIPKTVEGEQLKYILRHELTHISSHDLLVRIIALIVMALHFYNPLVYLLFEKIVNTSEMDCDAKVLRYANREERKFYGYLVISEATNSKENKYIAAFGKNDKKIIKERITMIKNKPVKRRFLFVCLTLLICTLGCTPALAYTPPIIEEIEDKNYVEIMEKTDFMEGTWGNFEIPEDEKMFTVVDSYYLMDDEQILMEKDFGSTLRSCSHQYKNATFKRHKLKSNGGCIVKTYSCKKCVKCGTKKNVVLISTNTYEKCTHK